MAARLLKTFEDIWTRCANELKIQVGNATDLERLQTIIQEVYLDQVIPAGQWKWLRDYVDAALPQTYRTGTAEVTGGSVEITLTDAPTTSAAGYWFSVNGSNVRYRVASHVAASTDLVLESPFAEADIAEANFDLWTDRIVLPVDWRETVQVLDDQSPSPLTALGMQKFRELEINSTKTLGRPCYYSTGEFVDPAPYAALSGLPVLSTCASAGNIRTLVFGSSVAAYFIQGQRIQIQSANAYQFNCRAVVSSVNSATITYTASQRFNQSALADLNLVVKTQGVEGADSRTRELYLYPSINTVSTNLHLMGVKEVQPLVDEDDEPAIPISDRNVLVYGTLAIAWSSIGRNPTEAARNQALFDRKLGKMLASIDDSTDLPQMLPSPLYLASKRRTWRRGSWGTW